MPKNIKEIMIALNQVLTTTVWVNEDRQIISLRDELQIGKNNTPRSIEDLARASLVGAYVSLQIRTDNFDIAAESLDTKTLALRVKEMVFAEAKKIMDAGEAETLVRTAKAAKFPQSPCVARGKLHISFQLSGRKGEIAGK